MDCFHFLITILKWFTLPEKGEFSETANVPYDFTVLLCKSDGNIRYFELVDEATQMYYLSDFKTSDPQRGLAFMPKRALNVTDCEVARAYKVHPDRIEPISFKVPRKVCLPIIIDIPSIFPFTRIQSDQFQADIYPDTVGDKPSLKADEWFGGKNAAPKLISLEKGFQAGERKDFVTTAVVTNEERDPIKNPQSEKEVCDFLDGY